MGCGLSTRTDKLVLIFSFLLISCAGQRAPEGGPVDFDPPFVASTAPANYTTRFSSSTITIEFNKYVDHRSVEGAIFISPSLGQLEFDWSGREIEIRFSGKLRPSTTYVVTVGTDVTDTHNRNKMASSYTLAFTTGEDIDHGAIEGKIFPLKDADPPLGVMIFAYKLDSLKADTLDPRTTKPDYVTQTGKNGDFLLLHLAFGSYRILAVRDEYKNLLYDPETDEFGVPPDDILLTPADTLHSNVWMRLGKEDTTAVRLLKAAPTNQRHLLAEFSSPIDTAGLTSSWFHISDTLHHGALPVRSVYPILPDRKSAVLLTGSQDSSTAYRLVVGSLRGANRLGVSPLANQLTFTGSDVADTLGPRIVSFSVGDSAKEVDLNPSFILNFSDAVQRSSADNAATLLDSAGHAVPINVRWLSDAAMEISPTARLLSYAWYSARIGMRGVLDFDGRRGRDSLRLFRFQTVDEESFSSIEGIVTDNSATDQKGSVVLLARNVSRREPKEYVVQLSQPGTFEFRDILEGKYIVRAYRDRTVDQKYDGGNVFPFKPSERFTQYPDTLRVRARWPLEGVQLKLQ
jgi:hypothetical protein